jgi:PTH1 family peptidyl-tRNA hydrolase
MKLIVGLGNLGKEYARNRHNVGFHCINQLARQYSIDLKQRQCQSQVGIGSLAGTKVLLAKPRTFVNRSGEAVRQLMRKHGISLDDILVIYDDLDLPLGKMRLRQDGSSGGHRGIKSIIAATGSQDFNRIRIGIGRPTQENNSDRDESMVVSHVLSDFTAEEERIIKPVIARAVEAAESVITDGIVAAMNTFN